MKNKLMEIQLFLIRICIGLDFFPYAAQHFIEIKRLSADFMVYFVGICTFLLGLGLVVGFLTRIVAILASIFLITALFMGHHAQIGFFWYDSGGGWEFLAIWAFVCFTFILTGGGRFSVDYFLGLHRFNLKSECFLQDYQN